MQSLVELNMIEMHGTGVKIMFLILFALFFAGEKQFSLFHRLSMNRPQGLGEFQAVYITLF